MRKLPFLLIAALSLSFQVLAQKVNSGVITGSGDHNNRYLDMFEAFKKNINTPIPLNEMTGSPYLKEEFKIGQVFDKEGARGKFLIRYNIYNDVMEVLLNDKDIMELKKDPEVKVFLDNKRFKVFNHIDPNGKLSKAYFEILEEGDKLAFLIKHSRTFDPGERAKTSYHMEKKPSIEEDSTYYIYFSEADRAMELKKLKKKWVVSLLAKYNYKASDYIKRNDLDLNEEEDVSRLINHINEKG